MYVSDPKSKYVIHIFVHCGPMHEHDNPHFPKKQDKVISRSLLLPFISKS